MNKEMLKELNEICEYLEISKEELKKILLLVLKYKNENNNIHEEALYEIIKESLSNMDYPQENDVLNTKKTTEEAFNRALNNLGYQKIKRINY